jgi:hypothetical protein
MVYCPYSEIESLSTQSGTPLTSETFADFLDAFLLPLHPQNDTHDPPQEQQTQQALGQSLRNEFTFPTMHSIRSTATRQYQKEFGGSTEKAAASGGVSLTSDIDDALVPLATLVDDTKERSMENAQCVYMIGNSLGLQPKRTRTLLNQELDVWEKRYVFTLWSFDDLQL